MLGALLGAIESTRINYDDIPLALIRGLKGYADEGYPVGDFLQCVIANDFLMAVGRADANSMRVLPTIAAYVYNEMPSPCHGSKNVYRSWIAWHKAKREGLRSDGVRELRNLLDKAKNEANAWTK